MSTPEFKSLEDFWPFYALAHSKPQTRLLHAIGLTAGLTCLGAAIVTRKKGFIPAGLALGYGFAWYSHFFVEGNTPATFGHPAWSFVSDFKMYFHTLRGTMDAEVERARVAREPAVVATAAPDAPLN